MEINEKHPQANAWLRFLKVKERPALFNIYFDLRPSGQVEVTMYSRNGGELKKRTDYYGILGVKQNGEAKLATEPCDEIDWDYFYDEVWINGLD